MRGLLSVISSFVCLPPPPAALAAAFFLSAPAGLPLWGDFKSSSSSSWAMGSSPSI